MAQGNQNQQLQATVDRVESGRAVLRFADGQELIIALSLVPKKAKEGSVVQVRLVDDAAETENREKRARELLEEILNPKE